MSSVADPFDPQGFDADGPGCETGPIMPHPANPNIVYGSCKGQFGVMNLDTGQEKQLLGRRAVALRQSREAI